MLIRMMLAKDVMITNVYTIGPEDRVALARLRMLRHGLGALPVIIDKGTLVGIITLRDIDLAGSETFSLFVDDLMTKDLITGRENTTLKEITESMTRTGIQRIPIIDEDRKLVGLITQTIVIKSLMKLLK